MGNLGVPLAIFALALLVLAVVRRRVQRATYRSGLDDGYERRIIGEGSVIDELDEPLDEAEIEQAEQEFWTEERWDASKEW